MQKTNPWPIVLAVLITTLVVGGGVYILQENKIKEPETPSEVTPPVDLSKEYEDTFLSFEYPDNVELLFSQPMGGRADSQGIEFLVYDESKGAYTSTNLSLSYMVSLGESESDSFENIDDLRANYAEYDLETIEYTVDDREAIQIITGDMTGETFFLVIPANESGDAYKFSGAFLSEDVEKILELFVQTAELKQ